METIEDKVVLDLCAGFQSLREQVIKMGAKYVAVDVMGARKVKNVNHVKSQWYYGKETSICRYYRMICRAVGSGHCHQDSNASRTRHCTAQGLGHCTVG